MIKNYLKIAWRIIFRHKAHSFINIGGLAISMSIAILIILWVQNELRFDNYHADVERIYLLSEYDEADGTANELTPYPAYTAIQAEIPHVERAATAFQGAATRPVFAIGTTRFYEKSTLFVDSNWVQLFDYDVVEGSMDFFRRPGDQIAISRSKARQFFGNEPALGQRLLIDSIPVTVGAVFADVPANSSFRQDILIPNRILFKSSYYRDMPTGWGFYSQLVFVKLQPSADPDVIAGAVSDLFKQNQPFRKRATYRHQLIPLRDLHFSDAFAHSGLPHGNKNTLGIFGLLAFLLLLTACVNFVNLSIARASIRHKEISVRKVVGATKRALFMQVMAETILAIGLSFLLTVMLVVALLPQFNAHFEMQLTFSLFDVNTVTWITAVFIVVTALTGIYPALLLGGLTPLQLFRGRTTFDISNQGLRNGLLIGQFVLAVGMMIGVMVIHGQFRYVQKQAAGYQMDQVFSFVAPMPDDVLRGGDRQRMADHQQLLQRIKAELLTHTAVKHVTKVNGASLVDNPNTMEIGYQWIGYPQPDVPQKAVPLWVDPDYLSIADIQIRDGRWFDRANVSDKHNMLINETAIAAFGLKEPVVGTTFNAFDRYEGTIIGVVKDFHHASLHQPIQPVIIELDQHGMGHKFLVEAQAGRIQEALEVASRIWKQHHPDKPFEYVFLDEEFARLYQADRKALIISQVFASLSLLISCLGILGMAMFSAQQRTKEIGIRKVLGSSVTGIVGLLSKDFVRLVLIAMVVASPIAWWVMTYWLENFAYHIDVQWWMFAGAGLAAMVIALLTVGSQAIRAAVANPVDSLRDE